MKQMFPELYWFLLRIDVLLLIHGTYTGSEKLASTPHIAVNSRR
jgi:hypothetical protein